MEAIIAKIVLIYLLHCITKYVFAPLYWKVSKASRKKDEKLINNSK